MFTWRRLDLLPEDLVIFMSRTHNYGSEDMHFRGKITFTMDDANSVSPSEKKGQDEGLPPFLDQAVALVLMRNIFIHLRHF